MGKVCKNCFQSLPKKRKEEISKEASRLKFWATNGYYIFICFTIITVGSFAFSVIYPILLYLGLLFIVLNLIYGGLLFRTLSAGSGDEEEMEPSSEEPHD